MILVPAGGTWPAGGRQALDRLQLYYSSCRRVCGSVGGGGGGGGGAVAGNGVVFELVSIAKKNSSFYE